MMKKTVYFVVPVLFLFSSCLTTVDLQENVNYEEVVNVGGSFEEEQLVNAAEMNEIYVQEELKIQDVSTTIIYVDRPVYVPQEQSNPALERPNLSGYEATVESLKEAVQSPEQYKNGTFYYTYNENFVYEIYAQPYHLTDIILEPGEIVIQTPLLSEDDSVWELTAGVAKDPYTGTDIQHLFVKPAYSKLDSTLVIITNRRVYHFRLKSFADTHMAMVKFNYPNYNNVWARADGTSGTTVETELVKITNPELLSFDYVIKYSVYKKPEFVPVRVYDDGQFTYIQVDEIVLQKKLPGLFDENDEIVNYSVKKNVFVVPKLINKVTLRLGNEKVIIEKKITK